MRLSVFAARWHFILVAAAINVAHITAKFDNLTFLYLVHAPSCTPELSTPRTHRSDLLLLVTASTDDGGCSHAIRDDQATWVQARNRLYAEAMQIPIFSDILYIVMVDGRGQLRESADYGHNSGDPWTSFENYLLEWEPAVAFPRTSGTEYDKNREVQLSFTLQLGVIAYHKRAAPLLLPYWERFEGRSLQSNSVQSVLASAAFDEHVLQFNTLELSGSGISDGPLQWSSILWIADSLRRVDDFLKIPWPEVHVSEEGELKRRAQGMQPYSVTNTMGYFDECHPYFSTNFLWSLGHPSCWRGRDGLGSPELFGTSFPSSDESRCIGNHGPSSNRLFSRYLLYLQEVFYKLLAIESELEAGHQPGECRDRVQPLTVQMSFPTTSAIVLEKDVRGFQAVALGLPRWDPFAPNTNGGITDGASATIAMREESHPSPMFVNTFSVVQSKRGWPPVDWYCMPADAVAARDMKLGVDAIEAGGSYTIQVSVWSDCRVVKRSRQVWPRCRFDAAPVCGLRADAHATSIITVAYPSELPMAVPRSTQTTGKTGSVRAGHVTKDFVYLVQNDVCADLSHLLSERSQVVQLNWKEEPGPDCPDAIYLPRSTLVQGRNRLVAAVAERFPLVRFKYYIIMDGNVSLQEVKDFGYNTGNAWTTFEDYLLEWEPAVGFPHFGVGDYDEEVEVQLNFNFDQIVVAYHIEAVPLLLPYTEIFDNVSWWYCGSVQNALCAATYNEHRLQFNALRALSCVNNPSPTYLRASNFLIPLTWIASAITSMDALMTVPWFNPWQSAMPSEWDRRHRTWASKGTPQRKAGRSYAVDGTPGAPLDFCHEYFRGRGLHRLCGARNSSSDGGAAMRLPLRISAYLREIRVRLAEVADVLDWQGRVGLRDKAVWLDLKVGRLVRVLEALETAHPHG